MQYGCAGGICTASQGGVSKGRKIVCTFGENEKANAVYVGCAEGKVGGGENW